MPHAGQLFLHLKTTTSTMDVAAQIVHQGDTQTVAVSADVQTAGRGRHSRPWLTFPGPHGLAVTFIVRPAAGPHVALVAALALFEALAPHASGQLSIKWPNDILQDGQKLAGILCQNLGAQATLIGMGVNLTAPSSVPPTFTGTFLGSSEIKPQAIHACLTRLLTLYNQHGWSETLHNSYLRHCGTIGQRIRWQTADSNELTGLARGLTPSGHLEMVADDGKVHVIHSGDIIENQR